MLWLEGKSKVSTARKKNPYSVYNHTVHIQYTSVLSRNTIDGTSDLPPPESNPKSALSDSCLSPSRSRRLKTSAAVSWSMSMLSDWSNFWNSLKANLSSPLESCWRSNLSMLRPLCSLIAFSTWRTSSTEGLAAAHNSSQLIFPFPFWSMKPKTCSARAASACIPTCHLDVAMCIWAIDGKHGN